MRKIYYANAEKINFGGLGLTLDVLNVTQNLSKQAQRVKNNFGKDALIKYHTNTIRIGNICPYKMQGEKVIDIRIKIKFTEWHMEKILSNLHDYILDADPQNPDAINQVHEMIDYRDALKKLYNRYQSSMSEIIGDLND